MIYSRTALDGAEPHAIDIERQTVTFDFIGVAFGRVRCDKQNYHTFDSDSSVCRDDDRFWSHELRCNVDIPSFHYSIHPSTVQRRYIINHSINLNLPQIILYRLIKLRHPNYELRITSMFLRIDAAQVCSAASSASVSLSSNIFSIPCHPRRQGTPRKISCKPYSPWR